MKNKVKVWALPVIWAGVIFFFSAQPDTISSEQSGFFARLLSLILGVGEESAIFTTLHYIVRKGAHFTVYAVLGGLCANALARTTQLFTRKPQLFLCALGVSMLYAISDEIHQYFVPGRAMMATDVLIDTCGAAFGIVLVILFLLHAKSLKRKAV